MRYKKGDRVRVKSLEWYNANKDQDGDIPLIQMCGSEYNFVADMSYFCGKIVTINNVSHRGYYDIKEDDCCFFWTDDMFEGLAIEETQEKMVSLDKACKTFQEILVELCPELLGYGAMAVEWENKFRKRLEE